MADFKRKRIPISSIEIGMVLADDVHTSTGLMLIPQNTVITQKHIFRVQLYQILSIVIKEIIPVDYSDDLTQIDSSDGQMNISSEIDPIEITGSIPVISDVPLKNLAKDDFLIEEMALNLSESFQDFKAQYHVQEEIVSLELENISNGGPINTVTLVQASTDILESLKSKSELFTYLHHLRGSDNITYTHSLNVSLLANIFANWLNLPPEQIEAITLCGLLHDLGKLKINTDILNKPGRLTRDEFEHIKRHSQIGYELIKSENLPLEVKMGILLHHEKIDGSGYPLGLKGDKIPDFAKIITIADIYDAMTSTRSYHEKYCPFKVIQMFEQESYGLLDTHFLFVFLENIAHNYLGKMVRLSNNESAKVIFIHNNAPSRPIVQTDNAMIDLMFEPQLTIEEIL